VARRALPSDTSIYAEIRKSTIEPDSSRSQNGVNAGVAAAAGHAGNQLLSVQDQGKQDVTGSLQDLTLIDNYIYKNAAECSKPAAHDSYHPGKCRYFTYLALLGFDRFVFYYNYVVN